MNFPPQGDNDIVICAAVRTPLTKANKGLLRDTATELLLKAVFEEVIARTKIDKKLVQEIIVGNVIQSGAAGLGSRQAGFLSGFPEETHVLTVNRFCASGLEACALVAAKIKTGLIDIGIGAGVEQMTMFDMNNQAVPDLISEAVFDHPQARNCMLGMGQTSENVAEKYGITRLDQDEFAVKSYEKAAKAQDAGLFNEEIVPVKTTIKKEGGEEESVIVTKDDGIRRGTTVESLSKLKPAFKKNGSTTAGNSSQLTDGAAAVLLTKRSIAKQRGLPILGRFVDYTVAGVPPEIMGIGPAFAIPQLLKRSGLTVDDIGIFEINEAFASQSLYCAKKCGIDFKKINPKGGAIAFGHPLGCTGARQVATLLPELKRQKLKYGVISMCTATGMGAAALIENEQ